ncbi:hypothetical protein NXC24_CH03810 [Rhizobium sp. NXC24]|nr:hypothetical protein NXC24_CH03810 [Rhizobium sp. NXC24]
MIGCRGSAAMVPWLTIAIPVFRKSGTLRVASIAPRDPVIAESRMIMGQVRPVGSVRVARSPIRGRRLQPSDGELAPLNLAAVFPQSTMQLAGYRVPHLPSIVHMLPRAQSCLQMIIDIADRHAG